MVEKMKFVSFMGRADDIDRVAEKYIGRHEVQLEYALREFSEEKGLSAFSAQNHYTKLLRDAEQVLANTGLRPISAGRDVSVEEAVEIVEMATKRFEEVFHATGEMKRNKAEIAAAIESIKPFTTLKHKVKASELMQFSYIKYRFGRLPFISYKQLQQYVYHETSDVVFVEAEVQGEKDYIYGVVFVLEKEFARVVDILSTYHFEEIVIPKELDGKQLTLSLTDTLSQLRDEEKILGEKIERMEKDLLANAGAAGDFNKDDILAAYNKLLRLSKCFDIRKYAAKTENDFYILVGWTPESEAAKLEKELAQDSSVVFDVEDPSRALRSSPPTKLKNPLLFRPFEFFVRMYGLPTYGELDPTIFVALTYTILFGIMFGDVGQGAIVSLLGYFLWTKKKFALGKIMAVIGVSSVFFGFMYGSVFGFEEVIPHLLLRPSEPENINTLLLGAVGIGIFLIFVSIAMGMASAFKTGKLRYTLFEPNGVAGMVFYAAVLFVALMVMIRGESVPLPLILLFVVLPLVIMSIRGLMTALVFSGRKKAREHLREGLGMFIFESFIDAFDIALSFFTNTVSFVRVGAFALSHASMMSVVFMMGETARGGTNPLVLIIGNIIVMIMEGVLVGIQVMRLEFYEMFSRFYKGDGRLFVPYNKSNYS